jgi:hypothetical protein
MRCLFLSVVTLVAPLAFGCGPSAKSPSSGGITVSGGTTTAPPTSDVAPFVLDIPPPSGPAGGINYSSTQVGSYKFTSRMDVPVSTSMQDETVLVRFGERKLAIDFDKRRASLDDAEPITLPADTKDVEVEFLGGKLSVKVNGISVTMPGSPK